jgi:hypothetical protein
MAKPSAADARTAPAAMKEVWLFMVLSPFRLITLTFPPSFATSLRDRPDYVAMQYRNRKSVCDALPHAAKRSKHLRFCAAQGLNDFAP